MDQVQAMRVYVRVAELGSFTAAADNLGLLKATVSNAVRQLENELGTRLLHRTTRKVQMTQDGQVYYERCRDLLADMDELSSLFSTREDQPLRGRLRVDMPLGLARGVIPQLPAFLARHPQLEIELSSTDRRVDIVREGFDCVVRVGGVGEQGIVAITLGALPQINCASATYLAQHGTPHQPDDLADHLLVHYTQTLGNRPGGFEYIDSRDASLRRVAMRGVITVNNSDAYQQAGLAGLGIVQAPRRGWQPWLDSGEVVEILPDYPPPALPVSLLYAHRRHQPLRVRRFMDWLQTLLRAELG